MVQAHPATTKLIVLLQQAPQTQEVRSLLRSVERVQECLREQDDSRTLRALFQIARDRYEEIRGTGLGQEEKDAFGRFQSEVESALGREVPAGSRAADTQSGRAEEEEEEEWEEEEEPTRLAKAGTAAVSVVGLPFLAVGQVLGADPSAVAEPQNHAANPPVDNSFPHTNAFIQLVEVQAEQNGASNQLLQALHDLNTTIIMNQAAEIDEGILVAQFVSAVTEGMILNPVIAADDALLAANIAFRNELVAFTEQVHLINHPPQNDHSGTLAMAAGGALLTVGAVAAGPALALGALNVAGFSSAGPVAGGLAASIHAAMGGITVGATQVAAGITALAAGAGLFGARGER
ncbi:hypothetical protein FRC00_007413 [Tulasnella sp. 408]|nr:hypothetical protein FRC00_007413 [Tulasnella sp. 408]